MKKALASTLCLLLLAAPALAQERAQEPPAGGGEVAAKLRFAGTQHEIIAVLLEQERYSEILPEFRKILELGLSGEQEEPVFRSAWSVVRKLMEAEQYVVAHQLIDEALDSLEEPESRYYLLIFKGKVYVSEGNTAEAVETYRRAQALQQPEPE